MTLTASDVAIRAGVSVRTVRAHLASGRLRGTKVGRDWQVTQANADRWIKGYTPYDGLRRKRGRG